MAQLTFNPDTPNARSFTLKEGDNTIGRADDNDFCIGEGGISGHHCRVNLTAGVITITDLNSTNGTLVAGNRITQATLAPGQTLHLGQIPVRLEGALGAPVIPMAIPLATPIGATASVPVAPPMPAPTAAPASAGPMRLRINKPAPAPEPAPTAVAEAAPPGELPPVGTPSVFHAPAGTRCRSHSKSLAAWYCPKCKKFFCDLCVATRASSKGPSHQCRGCGAECLPVEREYSAPVAEKGFFARIPGSFLYPVKGTGSLILIVAAIIFAVLGVASQFFGIAAVFFVMAVTGYLFLFLQNIIQATAGGEDDMPSLPDFDGLFGAFFTLLGTVGVSFLLPIALGIARLSGIEIPISVIIASVFFSLLYFPMAFLAVSMLDSIGAANPLVVIPSILKVPGQYIVTVMILSVVFGMRLMGDVVSSIAGDQIFETKSVGVLITVVVIQAVWAFFSIYLLTVGMRILGNLYLTQRDKLGWI